MSIEIRKFYDCLGSYGHWSSVDNNIKKDKKGKYKEKFIVEEIPCTCHPETCSHSDGKKVIMYTEKIYLKK